MAESMTILLDKLERLLRPVAWGRRVRLKQTAQSAGLLVTFKETATEIIFCTPDGHLKDATYGLYEAEAWLRGYLFARSQLRKEHGRTLPSDSR